MAESDYENNLIECDLYYGGSSAIIGHCEYGKHEKYALQIFNHQDMNLRRTVAISFKDNFTS